MLILAFLFWFSAAPSQETLTPEERAWKVLEEGIQSKTPQGRREAALAISLAPEYEKYCVLVRKLVDDHDVAVRVAALQTLTTHRHPDAIPVLKKALEDKVPEVVLAAASGLYQLNQPEGLDVLEGMLSGETRASSNGLVNEARDVLRQLSAPKSAAWFIIFNGIGYAPVPGLGEALYAFHLMSEEGDLPPRASVVLLLGRDTTPGSLTAIRQVLKDKDWKVRAAAVQALLARRDPSVREDLVPLLEDKHEKVRFRAAAVYLNLQEVARKPPPERKNPPRRTRPLTVPPG